MRNYTPHRKGWSYRGKSMSKERAQFPWVKASDPVSIILGARSGDILKKSGYSETAGTYVSYRYVV